MADLFWGPDKIPLKVTIINDDVNPDKLNEDCGAEFVHKDQKFPLNFDKFGKTGLKCASFDGDADRLIYFFKSEDESKSATPIIIDGDK